MSTIHISGELIIQNNLWGHCHILVSIPQASKTRNDILVRTPHVNREDNGTQRMPWNKIPLFRATVKYHVMLIPPCGEGMHSSRRWNTNAE